MDGLCHLQQLLPLNLSWKILEGLFHLRLTFGRTASYNKLLGPIARVKAQCDLGGKTKAPKAALKLEP